MLASPAPPRCPGGGARAAGGGPPRGAPGPPLPGVPLLLFLVDLAKMAGYPAGVAARLREGRGEGG
jgi:hypothetical protein